VKEMNTSTPTLDQLKRGLQIAEQIAALEAEMAAIFAGKSVARLAIAAPAGKAQSGQKGRRKFSAQALANIRAAQKRRWAKVKGKQASKAPATKKRKLSPKALANIRAAQKKRWAKVKAGASSAKAAAPKAPAKKKRKLAPEVRAKLAAAMKARWEAARKSGGPPPTAKQ
jgi:hypothetical protein